MSDAIDDAAAVLREGGLVAFPTETVYGLGALARDPAAVARIFAAKGRPADHPLIVHLASASQVPRWADEVPAAASRLMARFWPGPLTLILEKRADVPDAVTGGQPTVGLRVPAHPMALALIGAVGDGLAAPSANRFGAVSPTTAAHVALELGDRVDHILDGGPCRVGIESTIVRVSGEHTSLLRPGAITRAEVVETVGPLTHESPGVRVPGSLASHYAPRATVMAAHADDIPHLVRTHRGRHRTVVLGRDAPVGAGLIALSEDAERAAQQLYSALREVDRRGFDLAIVRLPDGQGVGEAVRDRILRASAPRAGVERVADDSEAGADAGPSWAGAKRSRPSVRGPHDKGVAAAQEAARERASGDRQAPGEGASE